MDRVIVYACGEPARAHELGSIQSRPVRDTAKLVRSAQRLPAPSAADVQPELVRTRVEPAFERAHDRRRDPR
jgi:hypothetical protein